MLVDVTKEESEKIMKLLYKASQNAQTIQEQTKYEALFTKLDFTYQRTYGKFLGEK